MRVIGWCGIHSPKSFEYIAVMIEDKGVKTTVNVNNPSSTAWVLSDNQIKKKALDNYKNG